MRKGLLKFQVGKSGVTENFISTLKDALKNHKTLRVSVLKSAVSERKDIEKIGKDLVYRLKGKFVYKVIGFTIILNKR
jgi:RNA-binding protein YhbY